MKDKCDGCTFSYDFIDIDDSTVRESSKNQINKTIKKSEAISAVNRVPEEFFSDDFKIQNEFFKLRDK
jgi:disulfide oxidoreductase YuzD